MWIVDDSICEPLTLLPIICYQSDSHWCDLRQVEKNGTMKLLIIA